jgi:coenzyme F420-0:L-glutamate ligase / coenzyme F420-1:gamma-L-glutamate ligase
MAAISQPVRIAGGKRPTRLRFAHLDRNSGDNRARDLRSRASMTSRLTVLGLSGIAEVSRGDDLCAAIGAALAASGDTLLPFDVVVVAQKIVSKAEGRQAHLSDFVPSPRAFDLAAQCGKDPRLVEAVLSESTDVLRARTNVLIVRHRLGLVMAQAGIDQSNVPGDESILLLPRAPDDSARALRQRLRGTHGIDVGVVISDSFGRPWRLGTTNVAIGCDGLPSLWDRRGEPDRQGRTLEVTQVAYADAIAGAAGLVMGEANESVPCAIVRGLRWSAPGRPARDLIRPLDEDLFR